MLTYDIVVVGGGLAGATLARAVAERGVRVLVLEREKHFKDRFTFYHPAMQEILVQAAVEAGA